MTEEPQTKLERGTEIPLAEIKGVSTESEGHAKPVFEKLTKAKITDVKLFSKKDRPQKDRGGNTYFPAYLQLFHKVDGFEGDVVENYGFRFYADAQKGMRAYLGPESYAGKLKQLAMDAFNLPKDLTLDKLAEVLKGKEVMVKSVEVPFGGKTFNKVVVQQFRI